MLLWPNTSAAFAGDLVARAMGLRCLIDNEFGWHKTLSNVAMNGVTGLSVPVFFDLHSADNDAGLLNAADITTVIRVNGFRFWGNRTCSDDPLFAFESTVRTAQVIQDEIAAGLLWAIDKPITKSLFRDIEETINARLQDHGRLRLYALRPGGGADAEPAHHRPLLWRSGERRLIPHPRFSH